MLFFSPFGGFNSVAEIPQLSLPVLIDPLKNVIALDANALPISSNFFDVVSLDLSVTGNKYQVKSCT
jgi:hypothetical protein